MNNKVKRIKAQMHVPGDKSISHRSLMIASIAKGKSEISGFLFSQDSLSTMNCLRNLGVKIEIVNGRVLVYGFGLNSYRKYDGVLDAGNSGTTMRLLSGLLSGNKFMSIIDGDNSLRNRPMDRIIKPLSFMGARIHGGKDNKFAPLYIYGGELKSIFYKMDVDSAQVKSSILFAGLHCDGVTKIYENIKTRDHTENMIKYFNGDISIEDKIITISKKDLESREVIIPGDISSASFFMVLASVVEGSELLIKNVGINNTRTGIIDVLREVGVDIEFVNIRVNNFEKIADIKIYGTSKLRPIFIQGNIIPRLIDEIPIICVLAVFINGETILRDIDELKYKESNRIKSIIEEFKKLGIDIVEIDNGIRINGGKPIKSGRVNSHNDHRIAMSLMILSCLSDQNIEIENKSCVDISFPEFYDILNEILK